MNKAEFEESRRRIKRERNKEDDTGLKFAYWSLLTWERARTIRMAKKCAKQALKDEIGDDFWQTHSFMCKLGKLIRVEIKKDDGDAQ